MKFVRPPVIPSLLFLAGLCVLLSLGTWQVNRYHEKITLEKECAQKTSTQEDLCGQSSITATIISAPIIPVQPRIHDGVSGYHIYMPARIEPSGQVIFINFGWTVDKAPDLRPAKLRISGKMIESKGRNAFSLLPEPEVNNWYAFDFNDIRAAFPVQYDALKWQEQKILFADSAVYADTGKAIFEPFVPAPVKSTILKPETHAQYAFFWFSMALAMSVIFFLRFIRRSA